LLQFADHALNPVFQPERIGLISLFDVLDAFMEDLPDQPAEPVGGRPDGFAVSQAYDKTAVEFLKKKLPLVRTAALAAWLSKRRIVRLPLGERLLFGTPADSSLPGAVPTHAANWGAGGKVAAQGPTSATICWAESGPRPGTWARR
jgi:hypothetical protein